MLRLKSRASCQCFTNNTTSCAKNVTIAQPRRAPPRPNRTKAYMAKGMEDTWLCITFKCLRRGKDGMPKNRKSRRIYIPDQTPCEAAITERIEKE